MGKKNNSSKKKVSIQEELQTESQSDLNGSTTVINSFIGNRTIVSIFLFVLAFVVFIPSLGNDFVWDDITYIRQKESDLKFSNIGIDLIAPSNTRSGEYFRPVHQISLIIDNEMWNTSPFGFHLTNIILHSISTVCLYFLILLLLKEFQVKGRYPIALMSSMLFALYPLHVESVSFISARGDILAAMFFFLAISFYILSYKKMFYLFLAAICFLFSFLSKEVAIALPVVIIIFDIITHRFFQRTNIIKYFVLILVTALYLFARSKSSGNLSDILIQGSSGTALDFLGVSEVFLNTYLFYFLKLVFPYNLNPFIDSVPNWGVIGLVASVVLVIALFAAVYQSIKKKENLTAFLIFWILATLFPAAVVAILSIAITKLADRFLYLPSAAICILVGYFVYRISIKFNKAWLSYGITAILLISFLIVTVSSQKTWKDSLSLWEYAISKSPNALGAKLNYADALRNTGSYSEALQQYIEVNENKSQLNTKAKIATVHGLAVSYLDLGNYQESEKWLDIALAYDEKYGSRYYFLKGFIALRKNDPISAERYLIKSSEISPSDKTYYLLGGIYFYQAENQQSLEIYKKAQEYLYKSLEINPGLARANLLLSKTYLSLGDKEKAKLNAQKALSNAYKNADRQEIIVEAQSILQMLK